MTAYGHGVEICTSSTKPTAPSTGYLVYCTDTDEYLKWANYGGANRWMQADVKTNRNALINGGMAIAQRSTSSVALTNAVAYGSVDRWAAHQAGTASGSVQQQTTSLPTGFKTGLRIGRTASAVTTGNVGIVQALETNDSVKFQGKYMTLSFWAKAGANFSATSNNINVALYSGTGTDQTTVQMVAGSWTGSATPISATQAITSSWVLYSFTAQVSASATQLGVYIYYTPPSTAAGADDNLYITGVQLEVGTAPSDFEFREYGDELRRCQRYYYRNTPGLNGFFGGAFATATGNGYGFMPFPVTMRTAPTAVETTGTPANYWTFTNAWGGVPCSSVPSFYGCGTSGLGFRYDSPTQTSGYGNFLMSNAAGAYIGVTGAEL